MKPFAITTMIKDHGKNHARSVKCPRCKKPFINITIDNNKIWLNCQACYWDAYYLRLEKNAKE